MITRRLARPLGAFAREQWTCPSCTRSRLPESLRIPAPRRRAIHTVPELNYDSNFRNNGVPGLFTQEGYALGWTTYQGMMAQKLNELTAGTPHENAEAKSLALRFARDPTAASVFNHASMAHNNHFFYRGLSSDPKQLSQLPRLEESLTAAFGSIDTLRTTFLDTAAAMFGPGFVWLVWAREPGSKGGGEWKILTTYLAGTPYPEAGFRQQGVDMNTQNAEGFEGYLASQQQQRSGRPTNSVGVMGSFSQDARERAQYPPGGTSVMPVLCANTWEHVYIYDFGLTGKRQYLQAWWDVVDWHTVDYLTPREVFDSARKASPPQWFRGNSSV